MTIKMSAIIALREVCESLKSQKTNVRTAYKISKILNKIEAEFSFYQNKFSEIVNDFSEKDENNQPVLTENGQGIKIDPSRIKEAEEKLLELNNIDVNFDITLSLDDLDNLEISISDMQILSQILQE